MVVFLNQTFVFVIQVRKSWETEKEARYEALTELLCPTGSCPLLGDDTSSSRSHFELCNSKSLNSLKNSKRLSEEHHQLLEILIFKYSLSCWQALRDSFRSQKSQDCSYLIFRKLHYLTSSTNSWWKARRGRYQPQGFFSWEKSLINNTNFVQ